MVLLVTLGRNLPDASGTAFTTVLTMFFIAYMSYVAVSLNFANVSDHGPGDGFDAAAAAFAGAAVTLYFTVTIGWIALRPLFQTVGLTTMAELAQWLLLVATVGGYGLVGQHLHRSGYAGRGLIVAFPTLAIVTTLAYGAVVGWLGLRSPEAILSLAVLAFVVGALAFGGFGLLPVLARHVRFGPALARVGPYLVLAYIQGLIVIVGFLLLATFGLA